MKDRSNKSKQLKKLKPVTLQRKVKLKRSEYKDHKIKVKKRVVRRDFAELIYGKANPEDQKHTQIRKVDLLRALVASKGLVTIACEAVQCAPSTHYEYIKSDPNYKYAVDQIEESNLDFTESKLHELINDKEPSAVYFHLKCKGKRREYFEKQQIGFDPDQPLQTIVMDGKEVQF